MEPLIAPPKRLPSQRPDWQSPGRQALVFQTAIVSPPVRPRAPETGGQKATSGAPFAPRRRQVACALLASLLASALGKRAAAASLSSHDLQVLARTLTFLRSPPHGPAVAAIAYREGDAASRDDATEIAAAMGTSLRLGEVVLQPRLMSTDSLAEGGYALLIAAAGADPAALAAAFRSQHVLCVSADLPAVESGSCVMAIRSEPRVEIVLNHAAAAAAQVEFATAFLMMIREI